jgi:hypothetical protein
MGIYWNSQGKYQGWVNETGKTMPSMYYTDNKYMNIFIAMNKVYYDIYNNGGGNLLDGVHKEALEFIREFVGRFNLKRAIKEHDYLEERTNAVFEKLMDKDLSFINHGFWNNGRESKISMTKQVGENWHYITCGTEDNVKNEFKKRKSYGFKVVE